MPDSGSRTSYIWSCPQLCGCVVDEELSERRFGGGMEATVCSPNFCGPDFFYLLKAANYQ